MSTALPAPDAPVVSVAAAIARMEAIAAALPAADGLACFNRMYLDVTQQAAKPNNIRFCRCESAVCF